jgi:hypothetical protein
MSNSPTFRQLAGFALAIIVFSTPGMTMANNVFQKTLTSVARNIHLDAWQISNRELALKTKSQWSVKKLTLHGGKQEGVDVIVVNNGKLEFTVIPTRGMSVLEVKMGDVRLGWNSPVKEIVHPQFINLQSRGGLGWLEGFNEWCAVGWNGPGIREKTNLSTTLATNPKWI